MLPKELQDNHFTTKLSLKKICSSNVQKQVFSVAQTFIHKKLSHISCLLLLNFLGTKLLSVSKSVRLNNKKSTWGKRHYKSLANKFPSKISIFGGCQQPSSRFSKNNQGYSKQMSLISLVFHACELLQ